MRFLNDPLEVFSGHLRLSGSRGRNNPGSLPNCVEAINGQICEVFDFPGRPDYFNFVPRLVGAEPKMDPEVVLRQLASSASILSALDKLARNRALSARWLEMGAFQAEADPVLFGNPLRARRIFRVIPRSSGYGSRVGRAAPADCISMIIEQSAQATQTRAGNACAERLNSALWPRRRESFR